MLRLLPFLLPVLYALVLYLFSARRLRHELDARSAELADPRLKGTLDRMAGALGVERIRVHLYETPQVNGLAAPDGRIFITRGFYDRFLAGAVSAEELASVVAHELGHVALGHSRRRMIDFSGQNAVRVVLGSLLGRIVPGAGAWLGNLAASLLAARLSRRDEFEADAYAAALLAKAGIGTAPQKALFAKLERLAGPGTGTPAWLASHPKTPERIRAIEALEARWS